jgi:hypothetical protein
MLHGFLNTKKPANRRVPEIMFLDIRGLLASKGAEPPPVCFVHVHCRGQIKVEFFGYASM